MARSAVSERDNGSVASIVYEATRAVFNAVEEQEACPTAAAERQGVPAKRSPQ